MVQRALAPPDGALVGQLAQLLAEGGPPALADGLRLLVDALGLRSGVLRSADGVVQAVAGEVVRPVPDSRGLRQVPAETDSTHTTIPVPGAAPGRLTVVGARLSQLPALRSAAAVLGLALSAAPRHREDAAALLQADDRDRDQLADALHDGPVQALVVARYAADAAVRGSDPALVREAVQEALVALRRSLWHLRPRGGDGLVAALHALSDRQVEAGHAPLDVEDRTTARLDPIHAALAFRVVQSLVLAGDGPLRVVLQEDHWRVEVHGSTLVPDDLDRWQARARSLGGQLTARSGLVQLDLPPTPATDPKATP